MNRPTSFSLHIGRMFTETDVKHMKDYGFDLSKYDDVKLYGAGIVVRLKDTDNPMPPRADGGPWPDEWIALFERWVSENYPQ